MQECRRVQGRAADLRGFAEDLREQQIPLARFRRSTRAGHGEMREPGIWRGVSGSSYVKMGSLPKNPPRKDAEHFLASPGLTQATLVVYAYAVGSYFDFQMNYYMSAPYGINPASIKDQFEAAGLNASSNVAAAVI